MEGLKMTGFENRAFRNLVNMKSRELELTEMQEGEGLAEELRKLVNRIYAFQQKNNTDNQCEKMRDNTFLKFYKGFFLEGTNNVVKVYLYKEDNFILIRECESIEEAKDRIDTQTI